MRRIKIILALYIISQSLIKAQDTAFTYYNIYWQEVTKDNAFQNRKAYKTDKNTWIAYDYYDKSHIRKICEFKDIKLNEKSGNYNFYYENGNLQSKGEYLDDKKNSDWTEYYENGKIKSKYIYVNDVKNGRCMTYYENGNLEEEGEYSNDKKIGYWTSYCEEGYKFSKSNFKEGKNIADTYWNKEGKEIKIEDSGAIPEFPGGEQKLIKFIEYNLIYPKLAEKTNISGKVIVQFYINEDGTVSDVKVAKSIGGGCDEEAMRIVNMMPKWKPGMQCNKPLRTFLRLPIKFTLR